MTEEEANYTAFEAYRRQEMTVQERLAFEQALAQDPAFRLLYQEYISWVEGIQAVKRQELHQKLKTWDAQMPPVANKKTPIWKIAASIILLVALSGAFFLHRATQASSMTAENFAEEPGLPVLMGSTQSWAPAMNAYRAGNHALALRQLPTQTGPDTTAFFKGLFTLKLNQPTTALTYFNDATLATSTYAEKASYYKAYALWQAERKEEARKVFEQIAQNPEHAFQNEAAQVLASGSL